MSKKKSDLLDKYKDSQLLGNQNNWLMVELGDICEFKRGPFGSAIKKSMFVPKGDSTFKVYEQGNAIRKNIEYGDYYISGEHYEKLKGFSVEEGDVIVSCAGTIGETYVIPEKYPLGVINQALLRIRLSKVILTKYFLLAFDFYIKEQAKKAAQGTAIKNLPPIKEMKSMKIGLPSLDEQKRIVDKIEILFAKLDEAKQLIEEAQSSFEIRRDALFRKVLSGDIDGMYNLIDSNEGEKSNLSKEIIHEWKPFSMIPEEWEFKSLEEICSKITDGTHDTPQKVKMGKPFITARHIRDGNIDFLNCDYVNEDEHKIIYSRCNPELDDILLVNIGAGTATVAIVDVPFEFSLKNVALLKPNKQIIEPKYLEYYLRFAKRLIFSKITNGGAQPFLSLKKIKSIPILIPSLDEQRTIISILNSYIEKEGYLNNNILSQLDIESLKKSILSKAFKGELVINDPTDEPAIELLKSILQEKL